MIQYKAFERSSSAHYSAASAVWNAAAGGELSISPTFIAYNTQAFTGVVQEGRLAFDGRRPVGFVIASHADSAPEAASPETGFIDLVAVHPDFQRREIGSHLLHWAEGWLRRRGARVFQLGGGLPVFAPGLPDELHTQGFFQQRGYQARPDGSYTWDVARTLGAAPTAPRPEPREGGSVRPARPSDREELDAFFTREFPGRWQYEYCEFLRLGGRIADVQVLCLDDQIQGFAWTTLEDSTRPLERYYPHRLPKPWGQIGPIGISENVRGKGWGGFLLQSALHQLRARGVRGMVIDWTNLLGFYEKYGFQPYRRYLFMTKR